MAQGKHREARDLLKEARYKAIEAAGKARIAKARGQMTPEEELSREQELEELKQGLATGAGMGLQDIFFDYDSSNITPDARFALNENAEIVNDNSDRLRVVVIEGYCDVRGTEEYNLALGQKRADSAKAYLVGLGVSPSKVEAVSRGETEKWAQGNTEYAYQQNRRAHFVPALLTPQALR
jgi:Outer membrane protein and related peptidoglycan-associated (lipo)proteins